jgi:hypothetical protein
MQGSVLDVSPSQGKGYPFATAFNKDVSEVILLATGFVPKTAPSIPKILSRRD